jgi:hypothetical protein
MALPLSRFQGRIGNENSEFNGNKHDCKDHWVDERLGLSELAAFARHKTVPVHSESFWYYWGGISLFLFLVQCFTGVLLLVYYRPGAEAYESVRQITFVMYFGWLSGRDRANIGSFVTTLHDYKPDMPYRRFMPPMVGTQQDVNDLTDFLNAKVNPPAAGVQETVQTARK